MAIPILVAVVATFTLVLSGGFALMQKNYDQPWGFGLAEFLLVLAFLSLVVPCALIAIAILL